ncbi:vitellogenin 3, phosvitinless [Takifugu rubripes]|uniref:Vitellogenin 3, phosvitinless n=1 Tax=Takifugu rubripes TaxID=31033 RepID=H2SAZ4_TAKRU|nr:vitellogenin-like [Takifugu rubripes]
MRGLLLCCLVALATCQPAPYALRLNPKKIYEYRYEGSVKFGLGLSNTAESGMRLTCNLRIRGSSEQTFVLQVSKLAFEEFNGFPGKNNFAASSKLTQHLSAQLATPFMFDYVGGHISNIRASSEVSDMAVNIVRGILSFFHMTLKTKERIYQLEEVSIHGTCQSTYVTEMNDETKELSVTQVVDIDNCRDKAAKYTGVAMAVLDNVSKQKGESVMSTVRYLYSVKPTADGGIITKAHSLERQFFTPFNVKGGNFKMQAVKEMVLLGVTDEGREFTLGPMEHKGDLKYKFVDAGATFPMIMQNLNDPIPKAIELIKQLAEANKYTINSATTENNIKLYQLLRVMPYEGLETMWKQFSGNTLQRNWFLDIVPEVNDARILKFLQNRFHAQDISTAEAVQALLLSINHLQPSPELVEMAKIFLNMTFSKSSDFLWQTAMLTYGSLVYRNCAYVTSCPINTVQPLIDVAVESLRSGDENKMVTVLKALGNAGHPGSVKTIMRFLPSVAASPVELPPSVLSAAVQSLRLIAVRDPHSVRDVTLKLFLDKTIPAEIRMLAFVILFETKPSMALVSTVTTRLMEEGNLNIISPAYSYLKSLATSTTPENHFLSSVCNVAVKILGPKFGRLSYRYSKVVRLDWFNDDFLIGTATEMFMLRRAANVFPTEIIMKSKFLFIGRILELLELGVRAEGIMEVIRSDAHADFGFNDFKSVFNVLKNLENLPTDKPVLTAYSRLSGQEWFFLNINKDLILKVIKALEPSAGKESPLWDLIHRLLEGWSWHRVKPFLTFEARYFQATSLGLPLEISKYYQSVSAVTVNAKAVVNPPLTETLGQLLSSEVSLESDGFIGVTKDFWLFYGISTELFQCGSELKSKIPVSIPWRFTAKVNIKKKKFEIDFPLFKEEFEVASISSNVYAVSRNIEDPAQMTPFFPVALEPNKEVPTVLEAEDEQMLKANSWHSSHKYCAESKVYGLGLCAVSELRRQYYHEEYPLYYFLGFTHMAIKAVPIQAVKPVEKIHLEFDLHSSKLSMSTHQVLDTVRNSREIPTLPSSREQGSHSSPLDVPTDAAPQPLFSFKALAMSGSQRPEGYEAALYYRPEASLPNMQLNVSQVGENANWRVCMDSTMRLPSQTKANIRWGAECQSYKMSVTAETAHLPGAKPTVKASLDWSEIPVSMAELGRRIRSYIPGITFLYGFSQQNEMNPQKEVSASVVVASADSVDVKVKFPEYTVFRQAIPFPLLPSNFCTFRNASVNGTQDS